jgi:sulfate permease, SulP family
VRPHIALFEGIRGVGRRSLPREVLAGVTLAALTIPMNIGYTQVAGLPPIVGLYASIFPMLLFVAFSSSRQLVAGPDAPIAVLIGSPLAGLAVPGEPRYVQLAYAQALVCAAIFFLIWFFRLGFLANFLSRAVLVGFVSGLGIKILTDQIEYIMGIHVEVGNLFPEVYLGWFLEIFDIVLKIPQSNLYTVVIGLGTILIVRLSRRYAPRLPGALVALVLMTVLVSVFGLDQRGVRVLGEIPSGLPTMMIPHVAATDFLDLFPGALAICGVTLAEALLVSRNYAQKHGYPLDANQQMFAFGAANVAAGLSGACATGSSASRTAAMDSIGTRSQIPSVVGALVVLAVLLFFADLLALVPNAVLGGIIANAVLALIEVGALRVLYQVRRSEFWIAIVCLLSVLTLGSLQAVIIAFLLSVIDVVRRAAYPSTVVLGWLPGENRFLEISQDERAQSIPGLLVYRFEVELFFANAETFREEIQRLIETTEPKVEWVVLDAGAISDIDATGAEVLEQIIRYLKVRGVTFGVAQANMRVRRLLQIYGLLDHIGEERLYDTNYEAAKAHSGKNDMPQT